MLIQMLKRTSILCLIAILAVAGLSLPLSTAEAADPNGWALFLTNLRGGPGTRFDVVGSLNKDQAVIIEGRTTDLNWILVRDSAAGTRGWSKREFFKLSAALKLASVPVSNEEVGKAAAAPGAPAAPTAQPRQGRGTNPDENTPLYELPIPPLPGNLGNGPINSPIVPRLAVSNLRAIHATGKRLGNNPRVFMKVGDCHTDHPLFLEIIGNGTYNLGQYGYLKDVISHFSVPARAGAGNSFNTKSMAAASALNAGAVLDWQAPSIQGTGLCKTAEKESPLDCEIRLNKPSVALVMFGVVDVQTLTAEQFNTYMRMIVINLTRKGVVPVLSTAAIRPGYEAKSRQFNNIVAGIARERSLPLINFEAALSTLPNKGLDPDGLHLSRTAALEQSAVFNDDNLKTGYTLRNLIALQTLDAVYKNVLR